MPRLFLASASPRRQTILEQFKVPFQVIENKLTEEKIDRKITRLSSAIRLVARQKAEASKDRYQGLILGVDTVVVLKNEIIGKPKDLNDAKNILRKLSDNEHQVISGLALFDTLKNKIITRSDTSYVLFKKLTKADIDYYCHNFHVLDKAGAYGVQDQGQNFIKKIRGSYYNVMGLPINLLLNLLKNYTLE